MEQFPISLNRNRTIDGQLGRFSPKYWLIRKTCLGKIICIKEYSNIHENDLLSLMVISRKNGANIQFPPIEMYNRRPIGEIFSKIKAHQKNLFGIDHWH